MLKYAFSVSVMAQPSAGCVEGEIERVYQILRYGATEGKNKKEVSRPTVEVLNTNGQAVLNATVLYKRRKNNYNQESDTLYLQDMRRNGSFVFVANDSVQAPYGGTLVISAPGYIMQEYPVYRLPQNLFIPIALGRSGDVFIPVFNLVFPLNCYTEFLEFSAVFNSQHTNKGLVTEFHELPCEPALAAWLNNLSIRYNLGSIAGPVRPAPAVGFDNNFVRSYGLNLPNDSLKRRWILDDIAANTLYRPKGMYYLYLPEKRLVFGVQTHRVDFSFPMNTPDSLVKHWLEEKGFKAEEPIRKYDFMGQMDTRKHAIARYNGMISADMLKNASALVSSGRAIRYRFAE